MKPARPSAMSYAIGRDSDIQKETEKKPFFPVFILDKSNTWIYLIVSLNRIQQF